MNNKKIVFIIVGVLVFLALLCAGSGIFFYMYAKKNANKALDSLVTSDQLDLQDLSASTRNSQRKSDVGMIHNAVTQFVVENGVDSLGTLESCPKLSHIGTGDGMVNLQLKLVDEYMVAVPVDPKSGSETDTQYGICKDASGKITVQALAAEKGETIKSPSE